jgi:hypothetical protein
MGDLARRVEKLERGPKYTGPQMSTSGPRKEALEEYFMALEDFERLQQGLPPIHQDKLSSLDDDPELQAYFRELEEHVAQARLRKGAHNHEQE